MLREVRAEGFRSLDNFSLAVRPGLNVLVGPNGGGKTNILALFAFTSTLAHEDLPTTISSAGGASKVFKKLGEGLFKKELKVGITANYDIDEERFYFSPRYRSRLLEMEVSSIDFSWDCVIDASRGFDQTIFSQQNLSIRVNLKSDGSVRRKEYDFHLVIRTLEGGLAFEETIVDHQRAEIIHQSEANEAGDFFFVDPDRVPNIGLYPIFFVYSNAEIFRYLAWDLRQGTTFNFDPSACKKSNDSSHSASLDKDGNGLAAVIYAMQKAEFGDNQLWALNVNRFAYFEQDAYGDLVRYFKLINPSISRIEARNDAITNKITIFVSVESGNEESVDFPLEFASDGTVKWLAFNVALLTQRGGFSIEEPENFLHPEIQRHAVELVRAEVGDDDRSFVLMTTHSESLLNASRADEIIVVSMDEGVTASKRLSNPHLISEEIRETGFGLGYYYLSGAFGE